MDTGRREFLLFAGVVLAPASWAQVRGVVDRHELGRIAYCRVSHRSVADAVVSLGRLFEGEAPIAVDEHTISYRTFVASFERGEDRVVICGNDATLVVDSTGCERFA